MDLNKKENQPDQVTELDEKKLDDVSGGMICPGTIPPPKEKEPEGGATGSWDKGGSTGSW